MCRVLANFSGLTGFNGRLRLESRQEVVYKMLDSFPIQSLVYMSVRVSELWMAQFTHLKWVYL